MELFQENMTSTKSIKSMTNDLLLIKKLAECPVCGLENSVSELIHLPGYPLTELFLDSSSKNDIHVLTSLDQTFCFCSSCSHGYLKNIIPPEFLYSKENYNTVTTLSQGSLISVNNFASFISRNIEENSSYGIDIGGNDSNLLRKIGREDGCIIDPNASSDSCDFRCLHEFIEDIDPKAFNYQSVDVISSHTLEHIANPHIFFEFVTQINNLSNVFIQVPCLELMTSSARYDLIHHQHLHYFSLESLTSLAALYGLSVCDHEYDVDHYGTVRIHLRYSDSYSTLNPIYPVHTSQLSATTISTEYERFVSITSTQTLEIRKLPNLHCYGASLMLPIVFYYYPCLRDACLGIIDQDKNKSSTLYANVPTPIMHDDQTSLADKSIVISAVATRSACRKIVQKIIDRSPMHIFIPFGAF